MSEDHNETTSPRFSFGTARIEENNTDYGDEAAQEFALLNGVSPREGRACKIPRANLDVRIAFPATANFAEMTRYMERVRHLLQSEARALWNSEREARALWIAEQEGGL